MFYSIFKFKVRNTKTARLNPAITMLFIDGSSGIYFFWRNSGIHHYKTE